MLDDLLIHDSVRSALHAIEAQPPQGLLLTGPVGIGKLTVATAWARAIVGHESSLRIVSPDEKGLIAIETIRELYRAARAKQESRQVIIIERADGMSLEAENAFLKLLEEPRDGLTFILTAENVGSLLPTILSRVQQIALQPIADDAIRRAIVALKPGVSQNDLGQLVFLAGGRPGVAFSLLTDDQLPRQRERMQLAKQLISESAHKRFSLMGAFADRENATATLVAMMRIVEVQMVSATVPTELKRWLTLADALDETLQALEHNGNVRAQLLYLFSRY